jgi:hypothetical protein
MAHELGITERRVAAQIPRLFVTFSRPPPGRAPRARDIGSLRKAITFEPETIGDRETLSGVEPGILAYEDPPFFDGVILGPDRCPSEPPESWPDRRVRDR